MIATKNRARSLERVLQSYTRLTEPPGGWQAIIVDSGTDSTSDVVRSFAGLLPVTYVLEPRAGKSQAVNAGLEHATGDLILFTDDDILPASSWLMQYYLAAASQPDFELFGGPVRPEWPVEPPSWAVCDSRTETVCFMVTGDSRPTGPTGTWLTGQNFAIRRSALTPDRRFDPRVGPAPGSYVMGQDMEFVERLRLDGVMTWWIADAMVEHIIRPEQLTKKWMLGRAIRFGRGRYWMDGEYRRRVPLVAGMPRWLIRHAIEQFGRVAAAWVRRDEQDLFIARWDLNVYRGALSEAFRLRTRKPSGCN